ncbi:hypothetical protein CONCODRAFT_79094, partial [Conidiobolus coronatus NRRL 28638]
MDTNNIIKDQGANWEYLPDTDTLLMYFGRKDLLELSKCCKRYRNHLESRVLESLNLDAWVYDNMEIYDELREDYKIVKVLEFLKNDLGSKLKFVKKFGLNCEVDRSFAEVFVKLLPNIKTLSLYGFTEYGCCLGEGLISILEGIENLENVNLYDINDTIDHYSIKNKIFSRSLKSLYINYYFGSSSYDGELLIYNTIDTSYTNLYSLTIVSNRMLQNLSSGISGLQEVDIIIFEGLNESNFAKFLKSNTQLRKLSIRFEHYNEEIVKTVLTSKYLEYLCIYFGDSEGIQVNNLPSNYSIKYLKIFYGVPTPLTLQLLNACKILETLDLKSYNSLQHLDWSKIERKVNILKLGNDSFTLSALGTLEDINYLRLFSIIHFEPNAYTNDCVNKDIISKLNNYKLITIISQSCKLKLI